MTSPARARWASLILLAAMLATLAVVARGDQSPVPGGTVPSTLGLSLSEPSGFTRVGVAAGGNVYTATIEAEVTSTDAPISLSVADGEATQGPSLGHMVSGSSILPEPLFAAGTDSAFKALDAPVPPALKRWNEPVTGAKAKLRLRQVAPDAGALRSHHKLLLITLTAAGP